MIAPIEWLASTRLETLLEPRRQALILFACVETATGRVAHIRPQLANAAIGRVPQVRADAFRR